MLNVLAKVNQKNLQNISTSIFFSRTNSFKSAIALEKLYPESSLKLFTPKVIYLLILDIQYSHILLQPPDNCEYFIPMNELEITYSKSSGPGGQNVNKTNTKVDVRFQVMTAKWLKDDVKQKIIQKVC